MHESEIIRAMLKMAPLRINYFPNGRRVLWNLISPVADVLFKSLNSRNPGVKTSLSKIITELPALAADDCGNQILDQIQEKIVRRISSDFPVFRKFAVTLSTNIYTDARFQYL